MNIFDIEQHIKQWNDRCGNVPCNKQDTLDDVVRKVIPQANCILEEAKELVAALEDKDETEIKDGVADVLFTSLRLVSLIGDKYDLFDILNKVCDNNDKKYTTIERDFVYDDKWDVPNTFDVVTVIDGVSYYCLKNENGKVVKPKNFPKVDLS
jgi:phosphoribosyl-ATP pyrophosphohydrolase